MMTVAGQLSDCFCASHCVGGMLQFFKGYDKLLTTYMRHGDGIGLDLTVVSPPAVTAVEASCTHSTA